VTDVVFAVVLSSASTSLNESLNRALHLLLLKAVWYSDAAYDCGTGAAVLNFTEQREEKQLTVRTVRQTKTHREGVLTASQKIYAGIRKWQIAAVQALAAGRPQWALASRSQHTADAQQGALLHDEAERWAAAEGVRLKAAHAKRGAFVAKFNEEAAAAYAEGGGHMPVPQQRLLYEHRQLVTTVPVGWVVKRSLPAWPFPEVRRNRDGNGQTRGGGAQPPRQRSRGAQQQKQK
jgi:hypothetical protein